MCQVPSPRSQELHQAVGLCIACRRYTIHHHAGQTRSRTKSSSDLLAEIFLSVTVPPESITSEHFLREMSVNSGLYSYTTHPHTLRHTSRPSIGQ